jgi:hypothetical protein
MGVRWSRMSWSDRNELWARWRRAESVSRLRLDCGARRALSTPSLQPKAALRPVRVGGPD